GREPKANRIKQFSKRRAILTRAGLGDRTKNSRHVDWKRRNHGNPCRQAIAIDTSATAMSCWSWMPPMRARFLRRSPAICAGIGNEKNSSFDMTLNDLLKGKDIDPEHVLVFRHRPWEAELNKVL